MKEKNTHKETKSFPFKESALKLMKGSWSKELELPSLTMDQTWLPPIPQALYDPKEFGTYVYCKYNNHLVERVRALNLVKG